MAVVGAPARAGEYHLGPFCTSMLATLDSLHQGVLAADFFDHLPRANATIESDGTNSGSVCLLGSTGLALRKWACSLDTWPFFAALCFSCRAAGAACLALRVAISARRRKRTRTSLRLWGTRVVVATTQLSKSRSTRTRRLHQNRALPSSFAPVKRRLS